MLLLQHNPNVHLSSFLTLCTNYRAAIRILSLLLCFFSKVSEQILLFAHNVFYSLLKGTLFSPPSVCCLFCINASFYAHLNYSLAFFLLFVHFSVVLFALYLFCSFSYFNSSCFIFPFHEVDLRFAPNSPIYTHTLSNSSFRKDSFAVLLSVSDLLQHPPFTHPHPLSEEISFREMHHSRKHCCILYSVLFLPANVEPGRGLRERCPEAEAIATFVFYF